MKKPAQVFLSIFFFLIAGALFALIDQLGRISETALKAGMITACAAVVLAFYTWWKIPARHQKNTERLSRWLFRIYWYVSLAMGMAIGYMAGYCTAERDSGWGIPIAMGVLLLGCIAKVVLTLKSDKIEKARCEKENIGTR